MHITVKEVSDYLEHRARQFAKDYDKLPASQQAAFRLGTAEVIIWDLIMDLDPDVRVDRIKQMKVKA